MLTKKAALAIYKTKILSYIDYNFLMYTSARKQYQLKLQTLQNKAIRIILRLPRCTNVDSHHVSLKIWHVETRYRLFLLKYAYSIAHSDRGDLMDSRDIRTRSHDGMLFTVPARCTSKYMNSFIYLAKMSWNCLNPEVQLSQSIESFSSYIKRMLTRDEISTYAPETVLPLVWGDGSVTTDWWSVVSGRLRSWLVCFNFCIMWLLIVTRQYHILIMLFLLTDAQVVTRLCRHFLFLFTFLKILVVTRQYPHYFTFY